MLERHIHTYTAVCTFSLIKNCNSRYILSYDKVKKWLHFQFGIGIAELWYQTSVMKVKDTSTRIKPNLLHTIQQA